MEENTLDSGFNRQWHSETCLLRRHFLKLGLAATAALLNPLPVWAASNSRSKPLNMADFTC